MQRSSSGSMKELKSMFEQIQQKQKEESEREEMHKRKNQDTKTKKGLPKENNLDGTSSASSPGSSPNSSSNHTHSEHANYMNGQSNTSQRTSTNDLEIPKEEKSNPSTPLRQSNNSSNSSEGNGVSSEILNLLEQQLREISSLRNKLDANESEKKQLTKDHETQIQELRQYQQEATQLKTEKELLQQQIYYLQLQLQNQQKLIDDRKKDDESLVANNTEKLKSKLKKQKERNEKLTSNLEAANSLIQTLQTTVTQLQEVVTKREQQLEEQKQLTARYQKASRQRRKKIEALQRELDSHGGQPSSDHTVEIDSDVAQREDPVSESEASAHEDKNDHEKVVEETKTSKPTPLHRSSSAKSADELPGFQTIQRSGSTGSHKRNKSSEVAHEVIVNTPRKSSTWNRSMAEQFSKSVVDLPSQTQTQTPPKDDKLNNSGKDFQNLRDLVKKQHSSGAVLTMQSGSEQVFTLTLTVSAPELTLTTVVASNWSVGETIQRLTKKFPGNTENFALFVKSSGKQSYMMLENSKLISDYKKLLEEAKNTLKFANPATFDAKRMRGKSKSFVEDVFHKKNSMLAIPTESVHDAIRRQDVEQLESLLLLPTGNAASTSYSKEQLEYVKTQLYSFDSNGQPSLHLAIGSNSPKIVQLFLMFWLHYQLDINLRDRYGWTALHCACSLSHGTENDDEILRLLLQYPGISADVQNDDKNHPLHYFCERFRTPTCEKVGEMLIQKSPSSVNSRNKNGETPLHKSVFNPGVRMIMVKLLVRHGADINLANSIGGETVLHYAVHLQRKDLLKVLLYAGADIHVKDTRNNQTPYELAVQLNQPEIADVLKRAQDLYKWLSDQQLTEYFVTFLREDLYLDVLAQLSMDENNALDKIFKKLKIDAVGVRIKIKKACEGLREKHQKKMFDSRLKKVQRKPSYELNPEHQQRMDTVKNEIMNSDNDSHWLIDYQALEFIKELGSGSFAKVFKGLYKGEKVAIKVMKASGNDVIKEFKKEFMVMSRVQSPEIVRFFGASLNGPRICLVIEYCSKGSLLEVMKNPASSIDWERAIKFFLQMSKGMETLHNWNPPIYHRDLKTGNLLLDYNWDLKLCDMGLARFNNNQSEDTMTKMCGTYNYLAPEVFYGKRFTDKADVFSMGIILWEISHRVITGNHTLPYVNEYPDLKLDFQIAVHVAEKGIRPTIPPSCPPILATFIKQCWHPDKDSRPTASAMVEFFTSLEQNYRSNTALWEDCIEAYKDAPLVNHKS